MMSPDSRSSRAARLVSVVRRGSSQPDRPEGPSSGENSRRPSVADAPRRVGRAPFSLRLTRARKPSVLVHDIEPTM